MYMKYIIHYRDLHIYVYIHIHIICVRSIFCSVNYWLFGAFYSAVPSPSAISFGNGIQFFHIMANQDRQVLEQNLIHI